MATILQCGTEPIAIDLDEYQLQAALTEESAIWDSIATQSVQSTSASDERFDVYLSGGGHMIVLGDGLDQETGIATVTSFSYVDPLGIAIGFTGNFAIDLYLGDFVGGSLTSFSFNTPHVALVLEGSMYLDGMDSFYGEVSLISAEALGVGVSFGGDLYLTPDSVMTGELTQVRVDWGNGQFVEVRDISLNFDALSAYENFQGLYTDVVSGSDTLYGSSANDTLRGGSGNDSIFGGDGSDTILTDGIVSQYQISRNGDYAYLAGPNGTDTLNSIEYLRFGSSAYITDVPLADALTDNPLHLAEQITDLYVAYFNRAPDTVGYDFWFRDIYTGWADLRTIARNFSESIEYQTMYPSSLTNREFVGQIYQNLFDRAPDQGGWDFWTNDLDKGFVQRSDFILDIIGGAYNPNNPPDDRDLIDNKHEAALYYTGAMVIDPQEGYDGAIVDLLNRVTGDDDTVMASERVIEYTFDNPITLSGVMADQALFDSLWGTA